MEAAATEEEGQGEEVNCLEQMASETRTRAFYRRNEAALLEPGRQFLAGWIERSKQREARISEILKKHTNQK